MDSRVHRAMRIMTIMVMSVLAGCGLLPAREPPAAPPAEVVGQDVTSDQILQDLRRHGLEPVLLGDSTVAWLAAAPGAAYRLGPGWIHLHTYPDAGAAQAAAAAIPPSADTGLTDWVAAPHFFRCTRVIVLYLGDDQDVLARLAATCGPPFAHQS